MREPEVGKENVGAVIGAVTGALGGLFAVVLPAAIINKNIQILAAFRGLAIVGFIVCMPIGWFAGGYLSHALERKFGKAGGIIGGLVGGLLPVTAIALWGWYMATH
jgi:hypothetical protein